MYVIISYMYLMKIFGFCPLLATFSLKVGPLDHGKVADVQEEHSHTHSFSLSLLYFYYLSFTLPLSLFFLLFFFFTFFLLFFFFFTFFVFLLFFFLLFFSFIHFHIKTPQDYNHLFSVFFLLFEILFFFCWSQFSSRLAKRGFAPNPRSQSLRISRH